MLACNPEMNSSPLARVRFLATIPNIEDLAEWLLVPVQGIKRFGEEMRPVKLTTRVFGYAPAKNDFLFERIFLCNTQEENLPWFSVPPEKEHKKQHYSYLGQQ